ncbi:MAG: hypothetical protein AAGD86_00155 [Pseudomonadota bacterium]
MKKLQRERQEFGLAFLDVISCGFGAVVLLVLISRPGDAPTEQKTDTSALLAQTFALEDELKQVSTLLEGAKLKLAESKGNNRDALLEEQRIALELKEKLEQADKLSASLATLKQQSDKLKTISLRRDDSTERDEEVGGIPVDSDYVIFIVDTSGSMKRIWRPVMAQLQNVLNIHPQVKGFQVMNDNGQYLFPDRRGRWLKDSTSTRRLVVQRLTSWSGRSNSSPVEGIREALSTYGGKGKLSLYVFGDDYSGGSYDRDVKQIDQLNTTRTGKRLARIHAVGFLVSRTSERFSTLMREVTYRNDGTLIALAQ